MGYIMGSYMYFIVFLQKNSDIHEHNTHQKCHYHMPLCRTNLGKCGLRYAGASVWNNILALISIQTSASLFSLKVLKQQYVITYFNLSYVPHDIVLLMYNYWQCHFLSFFLLHPLHPCWNILAICETDKEPINPSGFPAPFAPMIICCCICTGIYSLCLYVCVVYHNMLEKQ